MPILSIVLTIAGLCLFETVSSVDNAIINAEILSGMGAKSRKWFLTWGILIAVFAVRGLLPWLIVLGRKQTDWRVCQDCSFRPNTPLQVWRIF